MPGSPLICLADLVAADVGQVDVEQDQFGGADLFQGLAPGAGLDHGVTRPPQPGGQEVALGLVVVDDEHDGRGVGHGVPRMTPRMVNSSRSLVSSSLRSRAAARGGSGHVGTGNDDRGHRGGQPGQQRAAVHARHPHVGQDQVDGVLGDDGQRLAAIARPLGRGPPFRRAIP